MCKLSQYLMFHMSDCIQKGYRGNIHLHVLLANFILRTLWFIGGTYGQITGMSAVVCVCFVPTTNYKHLPLTFRLFHYAPSLTT
jgi:hypothetical protein